MNGMNSHLKSVGNFFLVLSSLSLVLVSCSLSRTKETAASEHALNEVSLKEDSAALEELRKDIPPAKRQENDELKVILSLMSQPNMDPSRVRSRFNDLMSRRRRDHRTEVQKTREAFNRNEKKQREQFLEKLKKEREEFKAQNSGRKVDKEANKRFYAEQDLKRRDFFAEQREKRNRFEAEQRQASNDFNSRMREWQQQFNQELRAYTVRYNEWVKQGKPLAPQPASVTQEPTTTSPVVPSKADELEKAFQEAEQSQ